ncbi:MAG TPA: IS110 family transposase [Ramlibacter sp.]|uniref:IS110 family transposase n=1 Tax=Ramlibacter sp. TaxID=1917967 RepID=UPI002D8020D0|nr:IS110 family transposase [Ramlibacter sp.]HET8746200.1 IS110 family transposase [Ramlibacter sp.]
MEITRVGLDLAKSVFQVHGVDETGRKVLGKKLKRNQVLAFFATLPACLVGMEACGGAHYWARKLQELGHTVKLIPPQYVKPYVKTHKNDAVDAEGICEAVGRPNMRFVAIKTVEQQTILMLHNARRGCLKARNAKSNEIRGELAEFGVVLPPGFKSFMQQLPDVIEDAGNELPAQARQLLQRLHEQLRQLDAQVSEFEAQIRQASRNTPTCRRLEGIPGIGPLSATAFVAKVGDARNFANGRQVSSWMGVVPRQHSSGGKQVLLGISKHGDVYLRTLMIHGARSVVKAVLRQPLPDARWSWLTELVKRRGPNVAAVALANKNARTAWALLQRECDFDPHHHANAHRELVA